jgi:hypothetical protein
MKQKKPQRITKSRLKGERGWTDSLIWSFMPEPDATAPNPYWSLGWEMQLYDIDRVQAVEATEEFQAAKAEAAKRKTAARKAVGTKTSKLVERMGGLPIDLPKLSKEELVEKYRGKSPRRHYTDRLLVNYLRHSLSPYEDYLDQTHGQIGKDEAYVAIKRRVLDTIAEHYPWLAEECKRQQDRLL